MPVTISGATLSGGAQIFTPPPPPAGPVLNLDAADYSAVPVNGTTIAGSGGHTITVLNPNSRISWNAANGGVFRVTTASTADFLSFGPDYSSGTQAYTVGMAYKWNGTTAGRLLNANSASPDFLMGLWGSGTARSDIVYTDGSGFIGGSSTAADANWHFVWITFKGITDPNKTNAYTDYFGGTPQSIGSNSSGSGFNGLRLFGRYVNPTTASEQVDADVSFVKVWNRELSLTEIRTEFTTYKARFGY